MTTWPPEWRGCDHEEAWEPKHAFRGPLGATLPRSHCSRGAAGIQQSLASFRDAIITARSDCDQINSQGDSRERNVAGHKKTACIFLLTQECFRNVTLASSNLCIEVMPSRSA